MPEAPQASPGARSWPAMFRSLGVRNYRTYFWGGLISNTGVWMQRTAQTWVVVELSGANGFAVGLVTFLQFVPTLLFSVYAGALADRFAKHRFMVVTQSGIGLASLFLAVADGLGFLSLSMVYVVAAVIGVITAFDVPARQAFASELVGPAHVVNAIGLNTASFNVARLFGPVAAGLLISGYATWLVFALHVVTAVAIVMSLLRIDEAALHRPPVVPRRRGQLLSGFRHVAASPQLVILIVVASLTSAVGANSLQVIIPLVATQTFGAHAVGFGLLTSALAVGGLVGALGASSTSGFPRRRWVFAAVTGLGVAQVVASLMPTLVTFALALVGCGAFFMSAVVLINTSVQLSTRPELRSRVIAVYMMFFMGGGALGSPVLGALSDQIQPMRTITVAGVFSFTAGLTCALATVLVARQQRRRSAEPQRSPVTSSVEVAVTADDLGQRTTSLLPQQSVRNSAKRNANVAATRWRPTEVDPLITFEHDPDTGQAVQEIISRRRPQIARGTCHGPG